MSWKVIESDDKQNIDWINLFDMHEVVYKVTV